MKLVAPRATRQCQCVYILSYGGGLVGGDSIHLLVTIDAGTTLALMTQGTTKIFKLRPGLPPTKQAMSCHVSAGANCLLIPDPIQPFAGSAYTQDQTFVLGSAANLIVLDWLVSGRPMNGESWDFVSVVSTNTVYSQQDSNESETQSERRLMARDCQIMRNPVTKTQMGRYQCLATLLFTGPALLHASQLLLHKYKHETRITGKVSTSLPLIWTVTKHRDVTVLKVAGEDSEGVKTFLDALVDECNWRDRFGRDAFRALE